MNARKAKLAELQKRYAWFGRELAREHREGRIDSEAVRFFIAESPRLLYDGHGEPALDAHGDLIFDASAEPIYFGRAQAYSYIGDWPSRTIAGSVDVSLQLITGRAHIGTVLDVLCADLNALHARELARATA